MKSEAELMEMYGKVKGETQALYWVKEMYGLTEMAQVGLNDRVAKLSLLQDILGIVG